MSLLSSIFGGDSKSTTTTNQTSAAYDLADNTTGAGDGSIVNRGDGSVRIVTNNTAGGAFGTADRAVDNAGTVAGMALGTAVNAQTLAAGALLGANQLSAAALRSNETSLDLLLRSNEKATGGGLRAAVDAAEVSAQASRFASNAAASAAESALSNGRLVTGAALSFGGDALSSSERNNRAAFGFAGDALGAVATAERGAFGFANDALSGSLSTSNRALSSAADSLDSSLNFGRLVSGASLGFAGDSFSSLLRVVDKTAERTQSEASSTRDFAAKFVGDFYESQKSGDVQTLQQLTKTLGTVAIVAALAWALRGKLAA